MKVAIFNCSKPERTLFDNQRFSKMVEALRSAGIDSIYYNLTSLENLECLLFMEHPDLVYCANYYLHDQSMNRIAVHAYLEEKQIPFIGSSSDTLEFVLSKADLKLIWQLNNISTPPFFVVNQTDPRESVRDVITKCTDFPYLLKPNREGNSRGIDETSIVLNRETLESKLTQLLNFYKEVLIEKYLGSNGTIREFTVAMIGNNKKRLVLPAEITLNVEKAHRIVTTEDKDKHHTQATILEDDPLKKRIVDFALNAFEVAGVRDYARCDILMEEDTLYAIEINGLPMIPDKWFEICATDAGLDASQTIIAIFLSGIVRNIEEGNRRLDIPSSMKSYLPQKVLDILIQGV